MRNNCAKCGSLRLSVKYDKVLDMLDHKCLDCEHSWSEYPVDRKNAQTEMQQKLNAAAGQKTYWENPAPDASQSAVPTGIAGTLTLTR